MYMIHDLMTGKPLYPILRGKIEKAYFVRSDAVKDAEKESVANLSMRVDVVEISPHAKLWMENQARMQNAVHSYQPRNEEERVPQSKT
jgi:hypothetical protein